MPMNSSTHLDLSLGLGGKKLVVFSLDGLEVAQHKAHQFLISHECTFVVV